MHDRSSDECTAASDRPLLEAYFATRWEIRTPEGEWVVDFSGRSDPFPALRPAGIVTAYNPASERQSTEENEAANRALASEIARRDGTALPALARGTGPDAGAWDEPGFAVTGLARETLVALARDYRQNAIVWIDAHGRPSLVVTRPGFCGAAPGDVLPNPSP